MLTLPASAPQPIIVPDGRPGYRPYRASVVGIRQLNAHFARVTLCGPDFNTFGTSGLDQRVKLVFPIPGHGLSDLGADDPAAHSEWHARWRALPEAERNPFRTFTVRSIRPDARELDVDVVNHSGSGPAARWLDRVTVGDSLIVIGPDARSTHAGIGLDWHPGNANRMLLVGDETAAPAICGILESLPAGSRARAFIEVLDSSALLELRAPNGCEVTWIIAGDSPRGERLETAVREWVGAHLDLVVPGAPGPFDGLDDIDVDTELLWESPGAGAATETAAATATAADPAANAAPRFYAWLAGEAGMIKLLRRFLVSETGVDRSRVAFMGYWRHGKAEAQ